MAKGSIIFILLGIYLPLMILTGLYMLPSSIIYNDADWLWITQMYAICSGLLTILGFAFYVVSGRR